MQNVTASMVVKQVERELASELRDEDLMSPLIPSV
jgi:hypothetical protein